MTDPVPPLRVDLDVPVTRRMRVHAVTDGTGRQVYHARKISEILDWLAEVGVRQVVLVDEDAEYKVLFDRLPSSSKATKGSHHG